MFMTEPDNMRNPSQRKDDPLNAAMQSPDVFLSQRLEQALNGQLTNRMLAVLQI